MKSNIKTAGVVGIIILVILTVTFYNQYATGGKEFRVATYNVSSLGEKAWDIGEFLSDEDVVVAGLQEADYNIDGNNKDMIKEISAAGNYKGHYYHSHIDSENNVNGIGIVGKKKFKNPEGTALESGDNEGCSYIKAETKINGRKVSVYNTYLSSEDKELRNHQMKDIIAAMDKDSNEYKIVFGDFNTDQSKKELKPFEDKGYKVANGYKDKWYNTYLLKDENMKVNCIDNIIVSPNIDIVECEMFENKEIGSDHAAFVATLKATE